MVASVGAAQQVYPPIMKHPWAVFNGDHNALIEQGVENDLFTLICDYLRKVIKIKMNE